MVAGARGRGRTRSWARCVREDMKMANETAQDAMEGTKWKGGISTDEGLMRESGSWDLILLIND